MAKDIDENGLDKMYAMVYWHIRNRGNSPSLEEIRIFMNFTSIGIVERYLDEMVKREWIIFYTSIHRGVQLQNHKKLAEFNDEINDLTIAELIGFPRVEGTIAAGLPIEHSLLSWHIHATEENTYVLKVKGNSMIEDHICDGDYVVIRKQKTCENGDIVVATHLLGDAKSSSTLKHFSKDEKRKLVSLRSSIDPIEIPEDVWDREWQIQGKLIKVLRWFGKGG